jgi:phytoene dehydrogenase-like protein
MYYGNAQERDMDFYQFVIMFKAIFFQGFAKPAGGMPHILGLFVEKYRGLGGELRMDAEVQRLEIRQGKMHSVVLASGEQICAAKVISSMGYVETLEKVEPSLSDTRAVEPGQLSFMESLFVLDQDVKELGYDKSITFFCTQPRFDYRVPNELIDINSGVLCCPGNFDYPERPKEGMIRLTNLANFKLWDGLTRKKYIAAKKQQRAQALESLFTFFPDFSDSVVFLDSFTPKTIKKYTGHLNGAVYGSPHKIKSGTTPVKNLFICGTDQGFLGIVGATLSGITIANLHVLQADVSP